MRKRRVGKMYVFGYEYGTRAIKVCLHFNFAVVFSSTYCCLRQIQTNYWAIFMSIGEITEQVHLSDDNTPILMGFTLVRTELSFDFPYFYVCQVMIDIYSGKIF